MTGTSAPSTLPNSATKKKKDLEKLDAAMLEDSKERTKFIDKLASSHASLASTQADNARSKRRKEYLDYIKQQMAYTETLTHMSKDDPRRSLYEQYISVCKEGADEANNALQQMK